jgi:glucokinase
VAATRQVLAADIGGTKLAAGVVRADGEILARRSVPTPRTADPAALFETLRSLLRAACAAAGLEPAALAAIGVGCGGPMRAAEGLVSPLNIPAWRDFPLRERLSLAFSLPTVIDNDAKAFALGEHWLGTGRGAGCLLAMVVSTGVGGGIVEHGRLIDGAHGNAGHIGHVVVFPGGPRCACGARGCLEAVASGPSLVRQARRAVRRLAGSAPSGPASARELAEAARRGDSLAVRLFERAGLGLGRGIASAASLYDLDAVVIGGGVAEAADLFLPALRHELAARARLDFSRGLQVRLSESTVDAALVGAARLALNS